MTYRLIKSTLIVDIPQIYELEILANNIVGAKSSKLIIKEIHITDRLVPSTFYPDRDLSEILILLTVGATRNKTNYIFELSHEFMHTWIANKKESNQLEEGLCSYFSIEAVKKFGTREEISKYKKLLSLGNYDRAYKIVNKMIVYNGKVIKNIRDKYPFINEVTAEEILKQSPFLSKKEANFLASPFTI